MDGLLDRFLILAGVQLKEALKLRPIRVASEPVLAVLHHVEEAILLPRLREDPGLKVSWKDRLAEAGHKIGAGIRTTQAWLAKRSARSFIGSSL